MPNTKNQFLRYEILHGLLSKGFKYEKDELLRLLNEQLENKGYKIISKRTLVYDLNYLEEQGAEIHRPNKSDKYYYYKEQFIPEGSQFTEEDIEILNQAINLLKGIAGFRIAKDVEDVLYRLKYTRHIITGESQNLISFEDHTMAVGIEWLDKLSEAIHYKRCLFVEYKPFIEEKKEMIFHPYFLKVYRNRWFAFGLNENEKKINILALDRIFTVKNCNFNYVENTSFNQREYFRNLIGVTYPENELPLNIQLKIDKNLSPYIKTKPLHRNQKIIQEIDDGGLIIELFLVINYELMSVILGYGDEIEVISPPKLRNFIKNKLDVWVKKYH